MKRSKTSSRTARTADRKSFARPSAQIRRRAAGFKLESLEERTLLSTGMKVVQAPVAGDRARRAWNGLRDACPSRPTVSA